MGLGCNAYEFAPGATPRIVETGAVATLQEKEAKDILSSVYGVKPALPEAHDLRVEFSIHPQKCGVRRSNTLLWEAEETEVAELTAPLRWPNLFSELVGDKAFGLLVADAFGYRSVPVEATPCNDAKGRTSFLGMKLKVLDAEAETVRRIFEMSASGVTVPAIATKLNAEHVAAAKIGKLDCPWNQSRVRRILRQERYVGTVVWNKMNRVTDPRTGRVKLHANPPADVLRVPAPELRIVSDELWSRVQAGLRPRRASSHPLP
jgi:hypothetical protein